MVLRTYKQLPSIVSGYPLDDVWAVLKPVARTNLVTNPSLETNSTGWTTLGGTVSLNRVATQQYHGLYSAEAATVSPGDAIGFVGAAAIGITLTSGVAYAVSLKFFCPVGGGTYEIQVQNTSNVTVASKRFTASGRWQWVWMYYTPSSTAARYVYIASVNLDKTYYVDGLQVEAITAGETVSTYLDGDQQGLVPNQFPIPYGWNGTPHASTSYRTGQTRAGGMVIPFRTYGWFLTAIVGLGLALPQNVATEYARIDGGYDDYTRKPTRQFTLAGEFESQGAYLSLRQQRSNLARLFDRDLVSLDQRLTLMRWIEDECGVIDSSYCRVWAKYQGGLEGNTDNHYASQAPITFTNYLPVVQSDGEYASALSPQTSVSNVNRIALRTAAGAWQAIGTGASGGSVYAVVKGLDGKFYIGGDFTSFNGVANTARICSYDPVTGTVAAMGTGVNNQLVSDLQVAPNGNIWAVGPFLNMGGVAAADFVAYWDGSVWNAPGTPPTVASSGPLVPAGGAFDQSGNFYLAPAGVTISKWTAATNTWSTLATAGTTVISVVRAPDGNIVFGMTGAATVGAATGSSVVKYDVTAGTFSAIGALTTAALSLTYDSAGRLYVGGSTVFARFVGNTWVTLGTVSGGTPVVTEVAFNPVSGLVYLAGRYTALGSITPPDSFATWNGAFQYPDIDLPGTAGTTIVGTVYSTSDGVIVVGLDASGTATAGSTTTITNTGTGRTYPVLTLKGPSTGTARVYSLFNVTANKNVYFNLTINAGETITMSFQPDNLSFLSDFQGNVESSVLSGSNEADFYLQPGANTIAFLSSSSTVTASLRWRNSYLSLDDVP